MHTDLFFLKKKKKERNNNDNHKKTLYFLTVFRLFFLFISFYLFGLISEEKSRNLGNGTELERIAVFTILLILLLVLIIIIFNMLMCSYVVMKNIYIYIYLYTRYRLVRVSKGENNHPSLRRDVIASTPLVGTPLTRLLRDDASRKTRATRPRQSGEEERVKKKKKRKKKGA